MLRKLWDTWKRIGRFIGDFIACVVLTLFYFTIFVPFGLGARFWSDPLLLTRSCHETSFWLKRESRKLSLDDARRGF